MVHTNEYNATCISCYALHKLTPNFVWSVATENVQIINIYTAHFGILMVTMSTNMVGVSRDPITGNMLPSMEGGGGSVLLQVPACTYQYVQYTKTRLAHIIL